MFCSSDGILRNSVLLACLEPSVLPRVIVGEMTASSCSPLAVRFTNSSVGACDLLFECRRLLFCSFAQFVHNFLVNFNCSRASRMWRLCVGHTMKMKRHSDWLSLCALRRTRKRDSGCPSSSSLGLAADALLTSSCRAPWRHVPCELYVGVSFVFLMLLPFDP